MIGKQKSEGSSVSEGVPLEGDGRVACSTMAQRSAVVKPPSIDQKLFAGERRLTWAQLTITVMSGELAGTAVKARAGHRRWLELGLSKICVASGQHSINLSRVVLQMGPQTGRVGHKGSK